MVIPPDDPRSYRARNEYDADPTLNLIPLLMLIYTRPRNHQRSTSRLIASRVHVQQPDMIIRRITREPPTIPIKET